MAATTQELIIKSFQIHSGSTAGGLKEKIEMIAFHYGNIGSFLKANRKDFDKLVFKVDNKSFKLTDSDFAKIQAFQKSGLIDGKLSVQENFVKILATRFVSRQLLMIENLQLETLNVNPILSGALNLNNEQDLIRYYTYQAISRSIVTSVGFLVEDLLLYASDSIVGGKRDEHGEETKWDLVVERLGEVKAYLEIKSGPNDLDKAHLNSDFVLEILYQNENFIQTDLFDVLLFNKDILEKFTSLINFVIQTLSKKIELKSRVLI